MRLVLVALLPSAGVGVHFQADTAAAARLQEGKEVLERITTDPLSSGCWATAVDALTEGCKGLDEVQRSKLAVQVRRGPRDFFSGALHMFPAASNARARAARSSPTATCSAVGSRPTRALRR